MEYIADLHIHSRFSRATSKSLDFENLYIAAQQKGVTVLGTGDFTHPGWMMEIKEKLVESEPGLFKLDQSLAKSCDQMMPEACRGPVRFMLSCEISNIYKKNGVTRKNHNLVFMPDVETAETFSAKLDAIGNIKSDGRPILGLDAKHLLEIVLETSEQAFLVPAHIWTPWFSLLGSKSGFDSVSECFEELTPYIKAVETGLSSDPPMNWRVSDLDGLTLISNSDAHSASKIGREANLFNTGLSYAEIKKAIETGDQETFLGTIEFFPEEGKYHLDGHRKCAIRLDPTETMKHQGICPVCGSPVTKGVLYRVEELADRNFGEKPLKHHPYYNLISLTDILAEILGVGPNTKRVTAACTELLHKLGPEIDILKRIPIEDIDKTGFALLGDAIAKMRNSDVNILAGYDGEFGQIRLFDHRQRQQLLGQLSLFAIPDPKKKKTAKKRKPAASFEKDVNPAKKDNKSFKKNKLPTVLNENQQKAVSHTGGPLLIVAGPGTGKTLTLTKRIARLIESGQADPAEMLAITFTNKAAEQLQKRLKKLLGNQHRMPTAATIHGLCHNILVSSNAMAAGAILALPDRNFFINAALKEAQQNGLLISVKSKQAARAIETAKQQLLTPSDDLSQVAGSMGAETLAYIYRLYQKHLQRQHLADFEDLIFSAVTLIENDSRQIVFKHIFVDEYQDINKAQYRFIKALAKKADSLCVIGDPDQSIYGFRGSDVKYFNRFESDHETAQVIRLLDNYRSQKNILKAAFDIIVKSNPESCLLAAQKNSGPQTKEKSITVLACASAKSEAVAVGKQIEQLVGGTGFHAIDFGKVESGPDEGSVSFSDIAVLYRTHEQSRILADVFDAAGLPYQIASRKNLFEQKGIIEILSAFRIVAGYGSQADLSRITDQLAPALNNHIWEVFLGWWQQNRYDFETAVGNTSRFPISGLSHTKQEKLVNFISKIDQLKAETAGMTVHKTLLFLFNELKSSSVLKENKEKSDAWVKLLERAKSHGHDKEAFIDSCALDKDVDIYDQRAQKVTLMTMHAAKGLEFPIVFVVGCEDDYVPFRKNSTEKIDLNEECRLFYVAVTRAENRLFLSFAHHRNIKGQYVSRRLSPFVEAIDQSLLLYDRSGATTHRPKQVQLNLF